MMGRSDVAYTTTCSDCSGKKVDRKNRKRSCPTCHGVGKELTCQTCGEIMPCSGTSKTKEDQSVCEKAKVQVDHLVKSAIIL